MSTPENPPAFRCESGINYERRDDMSCDGKLIVTMQPDGDMIVGIYGTGFISDEMRFASVEFTQPGPGGGRSTRVVHALRALAIAIQEDNAERPINNARNRAGEEGRS